MIGAWLASFVLVCSAAQSAPAAAPREIECRTCEGRGHALQSCFHCQGDGKVNCRLCNSQLPLERSLAAHDWEKDPPTEAQARELGERMRKVDDLTRSVIGSSPGRVRCPSGACVKGRPLMQAKDECKYCSGRGNVACTACDKKGTLRCGACNGSSRVDRACESCFGTGRHVDPSTVAESRSVCWWCFGKGSWSCSECDSSGVAESSCSDCNGAGTKPCSACLGSRIKACNKCYATGDLSSYFAKKTSNKCDQCDTKGRIRCDECENGRVECTKCESKGRARDRCRACIGKRVRPCLGCCWGAFASWEMAGDALLKVGDKSGARACFEIARNRVDEYYSKRARGSLDPEAVTKSLRRQRGADIARLDGRLATAGKSK